MKMLKLAMLITLSAVMGCGAAEHPQPTQVAARENASTRVQVPDALKPAAFRCQAPNATCLSARDCHHQEGINIGVAGCPSGTTCCVF